MFSSGPGSSTTDACGEIYAGSAPFSEIETKTLSEFIGSVSDKLFAYISFHSYIQKLMFPYGFTAAHLDNYDQQVELENNFALDFCKNCVHFNYNLRSSSFQTIYVYYYILYEANSEL